MTKGDMLVWGIILGILVLYFGGKKFRSYRIKKMLKNAKSAERRAITILERAGYRVIDAQLKERVITTIDNTAHSSMIKADFLVRKGFKKYIVEVKTGNQAQITLPNVRRQMLEYYLVYQPSGLLFLDMEREKIKVIQMECAVKITELRKKMLFCLFIGLLGGYIIFGMIFV